MKLNRNYTITGLISSQIANHSHSLSILFCSWKKEEIPAAVPAYHRIQHGYPPAIEEAKGKSWKSHISPIFFLVGAFSHEFP